MCDAHVIGVSEVVLQPFEPLREFLQVLLIEQTFEKLDSIAQLLAGNPQFVPLSRVQPAEMLAALPHLSPASVEQQRRHLADRLACRIGTVEWRTAAPTACLEPVQKMQHQSGIALGKDYFPDPLVGGPAQPIDSGSQIVEPGFIVN